MTTCEVNEHQCRREARSCMADSVCSACPYRFLLRSRPSRSNPARSLARLCISCYDNRILVHPIRLVTTFSRLQMDSLAGLAQRKRDETSAPFGNGSVHSALFACVFRSYSASHRSGSYLTVLFSSLYTRTSRHGRLRPGSAVQSRSSSLRMSTKRVSVSLGVQISAQRKKERAGRGERTYR